MRGGAAPFEVTGTSGVKANDPEGGSRGDEQPLNPEPSGPAVISDMELLSRKAEFVGRAVRFAAIPVVTAPGPHTFWVGRPGNRTLVVMDDKTRRMLLGLGCEVGQGWFFARALPADEVAAWLANFSGGSGR